MEALQQSVVKLARNPCALADARVQRHLELMMQLPQTPLVGRPQKSQEHRAEGAKPIRLVVRGCDGEIELWRANRPTRRHCWRRLHGRNTSREANPCRRPAGACRRHANHGRSRRAGSEISPSEESKRRRSVINLQVVGVRGKLQVIGCRELLSVNGDRLDIGLCRQSLLQDSGRIHHFTGKLRWQTIRAHPERVPPN